VKILYIAPHLSTGGLPQFLLKKIQILKKQCEIYCVEYADHGGFVVQKNQIIDLLKDKFFTLREDKNNLLKIINQINPDVLHLEEMPEYFMDNALAEKIYSKERKYTIVETSHDSSFDSSSKRFFPDKFTFVSEFQKRNVESLNIPSEVHEYPISIKIRKSREEALKTLGLDPSKKHIVNVGLFTPRKNQAEIIEYAKSLINYPIQFHFIGNQADNFKFYWEPLMKEWPSNCTWWNERKDVENFYQAADLFLFTSRGSENNKETSPLVIREAISFNVPSLIYNLPVYLGMYDKFHNVEYLNFEDLKENENKILDKLNIASLDDYAFIVSSYPTNNCTTQTTQKCIESLKRISNAPVILTSHCSVPEVLQNVSDYCVVDKNNILTKHTFYKTFTGHAKQNDIDYQIQLFLDKTDNDVYHGPAVYTNYYNGINFAKKLGCKKAICVNFDFLINSKKFLSKILSKLEKNDAYFVEEPCQEGNTFKTVFHAIKTELFANEFPLIKNQLEYNDWMKTVGSESNGLENIYFHNLKDQRNVYKSSLNEYNEDVRDCEIDSNSQVEYFAVLPVENENKLAVIFHTSNSIDNRLAELTLNEERLTVEINGRQTFIKTIEKSNKPINIDLIVKEEKEIYAKKIVVDEEYLSKINEFGLVKKI
jgi:glycosyltransferase involved in cell wall biosynthesis